MQRQNNKTKGEKITGKKNTVFLLLLLRTWLILQKRQGTHCLCHLWLCVLCTDSQKGKKVHLNEYTSRRSIFYCSFFLSIIILKTKKRCVSMYIYIYIYVYMCMCVCVCVRACLLTMCVYVYMCVCCVSLFLARAAPRTRSRSRLMWTHAHALPAQGFCTWSWRRCTLDGASDFWKGQESSRTKIHTHIHKIQQIHTRTKFVHKLHSYYWVSGFLEMSLFCGRFQRETMWESITGKS